MERIQKAWQSRPTLSVELENKGSVARDHLASERTFLAWLRTSLALVSLGVAIAQLFKLPELSESPSNGTNYMEWPVEGSTYDSQQVFGFSTSSRLESLERLGKPLGATCIALGAFCLLAGAYRYQTVQNHLMRGQYPPSRVSISLMSFSVSALIIAAFAVVVAVKARA